MSIVMSVFSWKNKSAQNSNVARWDPLPQLGWIHVKTLLSILLCYQGFFLGFLFCLLLLLLLPRLFFFCFFFVFFKHCYQDFFFFFCYQGFVYWLSSHFCPQCLATKAFVYWPSSRQSTFFVHITLLPRPGEIRCCLGLQSSRAEFTSKNSRPQHFATKARKHPLLLEFTKHPDWNSHQSTLVHNTFATEALSTIGPVHAQRTFVHNALLPSLFCTTLTETVDFLWGPTYS